MTRSVQVVLPVLPLGSSTGVPPHRYSVLVPVRTGSTTPEARIKQEQPARSFRDAGRSFRRGPGPVLAVLGTAAAVRGHLIGDRVSALDAAETLACTGRGNYEATNRGVG